METLITGLVIFVAVHFIPLNSELRARMISRMGEGAYKGVFSLLSIIGFYLIVSGKAHAPTLVVWNPPAWSEWLTIVMMFVAITLIVAAYMPSDIKRVIAHPMLWGVVAWSVAHLVSNGDVASIILFSGFAIFAIVSIIASAKKAKPEGQQADKKVTLNWRKNITVVALGAVVYASIIVFHASLFGKAILVAA